MAGGRSRELDNKINAFRALCAEAGLKATPQRVAVYAALVECNTHPSADMLYEKLRKRLPGISLDTVNRTLLTLAEIGAATIVEGTGDSRRFDGRIETHQHFRCVKCRKIIDFHHAPFDNIDVPANILRGHVVLRKTVYLEGICRDCRKKQSRSRKK